MNRPTKPAAVPASAPADPWWKVGMFWMVWGLPMTAVVAATASAVIAIHGADPVVKGYQNQFAQHAVPARDQSADALGEDEQAGNHASMKH